MRVIGDLILFLYIPYDSYDMKTKKLIKCKPSTALENSV